VKPLSHEDRTHWGENWKRFKRDWSYYKVATKIHEEEDDEVRVAHLLNITGKDAQDLYNSQMTTRRTLPRFLQLLKHAVYIYEC